MSSIEDYSERQKEYDVHYKYDLSASHIRRLALAPCGSANSKRQRILSFAIVSPCLSCHQKRQVHLVQFFVYNEDQLCHIK